MRKRAKPIKRGVFEAFTFTNRRLETLYRKVSAQNPAIAENVIISLTTFPLRIGKLHHVIASLLDQSVQPRKIVLYLSDGEFRAREVPKPLARLEGERFEIRFVAENLRSYNKLMFALKDFTHEWIATADDDRLYPVNWLARLLQGAGETPGAIISTVGRKILMANGRFLPFRDWPYDNSIRPSLFLFPVGSWGILYPPGSLNAAVSDRELIRKLAPLDDDAWFKAMSLLQNVPCRSIGKTEAMPSIRFKHDVRLWEISRHGELTDEALKLVFNHFGLTTDALPAKEACLRETQQQNTSMEIRDPMASSVTIRSPSRKRL